MIKLQEGEEIIIAFHRHWIVVATKMTLVAALLLPPLVALLAMPAFDLAGSLKFFFLFLVIIYLLVVTLVAFVVWADYYLDVWIVTNVRIIDVEQKGMFEREVSEFLLSRVQDITIEIPSFIATLLHYGNLKVQTAGDEGFLARDIPHVDKVKDIIIKELRKTNVGSL